VLLLSADDNPRDFMKQLWYFCHQLLEGGACQYCQIRIADRTYGGRTRFVGQQGKFTHGMTGRDFTQLSFLAVGIKCVDAQQSVNDDIHFPARLPLPEEYLAAIEALPG